MSATTPLRELWDTTRMRLLVEIGRQGSLSAAASAIGIGQPSASQHLRLLEAAAGQRLVERTGRGSRLTEAGQVRAARALLARRRGGGARCARGTADGHDPPRRVDRSRRVPPSRHARLLPPRLSRRVGRGRDRGERRDPQASGRRPRPARARRRGGGGRPHRARTVPRGRDRRSREAGIRAAEERQAGDGATVAIHVAFARAGIELPRDHRRGAARDRHRARRRLGARLERGDQARGARGARARVPVALRRRRGGRARRPRILPPCRTTAARTPFLGRPARGPSAFACRAKLRRHTDKLLRQAGRLRRGLRRRPEALLTARVTVPRELPAGTVTFLFTDVEGSTKLLTELGAEAYAAALAEHRHALREAFLAYGGVEVDTQGDAFFVAFPTAPGALAAAAAASEALSSGPIRVRIGLHTGTPHLAEDGYVGVDVHRAARIAAAGHGGQVLVSASTAALLSGDGLRDLGEHRLKDLSGPERIFQLGDGEFPPLKSLYRTNLPIPATPFLGREHELAQVCGLLADARLLTLTGPGGTGKTRLGLQAAADAADGYPDGVFWE